jgi:hypothetical protein
VPTKRPRGWPTVKCLLPACVCSGSAQVTPILLFFSSSSSRSSLRRKIFLSRRLKCQQVLCKVTTETTVRASLQYRQFTYCTCTVHNNYAFIQLPGPISHPDPEREERSSRNQEWNIQSVNQSRALPRAEGDFMRVFVD